MLKHIRHCGIVVSDMNRSLCFYTQLLGFCIVADAEECGPCLDKVLALPEVEVRTVKLGIANEDTLLELLQFHTPQSPQPRGLAIHRIGLTHLALTVEDLDTLYEQLIQCGVRTASPPQWSADGRVKLLFCEDPDGVHLELVEER